jgi:hypothetical protein
VGVGADAGQVAAIVKNEVHDQERDVADRVGEAKALGEFNAVDDEQIVGRRAIGKEVNVR